MQRLDETRRAEIAELAEHIAEEYFPSEAVNPGAILEAKNITQSFGEYGDYFDGMLECADGKFHVYCNLDRVGDRRSPRARFTLAHELAHYFIDDHRQALLSGAVPSHPSQCEFESKNLVEREADSFASNLLLPRRRFLEAAQDARRGLGGILELARQFQTSVTATAVRYASCDVVPCAVLKWSAKGLDWKWLSTETFRARYRKTIEAVEDLPEGSSTADALEGKRPLAADYFERGSTAAAWFPFLSQESHRNAIMVEQAAPLGQFGVLTFLYPESGRYW